jgi:microcompartment protein CcmK/EutM
MYLAKVKGNVISSVKNKKLNGHKLLLTHQVDYNGKKVGIKDAIAIDLVDSGIGDIVIVVQEGDAVEQILGNSLTPVNTMIIAIVDNIEIRE